MEVIMFSVLSAILFSVLCIASFMYYRRYRASISQDSTPDTLNTENKPDPKKTKHKGKESKQKAKQKKKLPQQKKKPPIPAGPESDTESFTTDEQLAQTIKSQHQFTRDSINTSAVNAKPTIKKATLSQRSNSKTRKGSLNEEVLERDPDWENVVSRKHKKKLYPMTKRGEKFEFTLDGEGGIVELPFCEMHFPAESVVKPRHLLVEEENYKKFETEGKVFVTPAIHFTTDEESKLCRKFTMKLNTMKMMGRGWDGNVCCQIETKDSNDSWITVGRTEYIFGKPVLIVGDDLTSFRVVITRGQNGAISRELTIAAYIARPKVQNPTHHFVHLCIYNRSQQTLHKVESNMQKFLLKMEPRICKVQFGCDLQFKIQPSKKFTPDEKDVFMRWTEVCKAFVNVRFQIRLNRNEADDPNFEPEYRSVVFLNILKVAPAGTTMQEEYFHFYWISATLYPKNGKAKGRKVKGRDNHAKVSEDDGFASGSDTLTTPDTENPTKIMEIKANLNFTAVKPPIPPQNSVVPKRKRNRKTVFPKQLSGADSTQNGPRTSSSAHSQQAKPAAPVKTQPSTTASAQVGPTKASFAKPSSAAQLPQTKKVHSLPVKVTNQTTVQSSATKNRPMPTSKKPSEVNRDSSANNNANVPRPVNSQTVQSTPTVLPLKGNPRQVRTKKPQNTSTSSGNFNFKNREQYSIVKTQEFVRRTEKAPSSTPNPTVNGPLSAPSSISGSATPQKNPFRYRSPKEEKPRDRRSESKGHDPRSDLSSVTARITEKGAGDVGNHSTQRQEKRSEVVTAPSGGDSLSKVQSKVVQTQYRKEVNVKPQSFSHDVHANPARQQQRKFQERNRPSMSKPVNHTPNSDLPRQTMSPTKPTKTRPPPQRPHLQRNEPIQRVTSPVAKQPISADKKLTNGPIADVTSGEAVAADPKPRRPRNRRRGPPPGAQPQPRPITSQAS